MSASAEHARRMGPRGRGGLGDDPHLFVLVEVLHDDVEHEAVELRLRQRIRALELDRVLRGQHEERPLELVGAAGRRDVVLLHRFEQRGLRLGRRPVDLVGEDDLREDRALHEPQPAHAVALVEDLGARDVGGHQVGRELDALEAQVQNLGQRLDQQRLGQARHAGDQAVPAREERHQDLIDHLVLPDDDLAQLRQDLRARVGHLLGNAVADCPAAERRHSDSLCSSARRAHDPRPRLTLPPPSTSLSASTRTRSR